MRVVCPFCQSRYEVAFEFDKTDQVIADCSVCKREFIVRNKSAYKKVVSTVDEAETDPEIFASDSILLDSRIDLESKILESKIDEYSDFFEYDSAGAKVNSEKINNVTISNQDDLGDLEISLNSINYLTGEADLWKDSEILMTEIYKDTEDRLAKNRKVDDLESLTTNNLVEIDLPSQDIQQDQILTENSNPNWRYENVEEMLGSSYFEGGYSKDKEKEYNKDSILGKDDISVLLAEVGGHAEAKDHGQEGEDSAYSTAGREQDLDDIEQLFELTEQLIAEERKGSLRQRRKGSLIDDIARESKIIETDSYDSYLEGVLDESGSDQVLEEGVGVENKDLATVYYEQDEDKVKIEDVEQDDKKGGSSDRSTIVFLPDQKQEGLELQDKKESKEDLFEVDQLDPESDEKSEESKDQISEDELIDSESDEKSEESKGQISEDELIASESDKKSEESKDQISEDELIASESDKKSEESEDQISEDELIDSESDEKSEESEDQISEDELIDSESDEKSEESKDQISEDELIDSESDKKSEESKESKDQLESELAESEKLQKDKPNKKQKTAPDINDLFDLSELEVREDDTEDESEDFLSSEDVDADVEKESEKSDSVSTDDDSDESVDFGDKFEIGDSDDRYEKVNNLGNDIEDIGRSAEKKSKKSKEIGLGSYADVEKVEDLGDEIESHDEDSFIDSQDEDKDILADLDSFEQVNQDASSFEESSKQDKEDSKDDKREIDKAVDENKIAKSKGIKLSVVAFLIEKVGKTVFLLAILGFSVFLLSGGYFLGSYFSSGKRQVSLEPASLDSKKEPKEASATEKKKESLDDLIAFDKIVSSNEPLYVGVYLPLEFDKEQIKIISMDVGLKFNPVSMADEFRSRPVLVSEMIEEKVENFFKDKFYDNTEFVDDKLERYLLDQLKKEKAFEFLDSLLVEKIRFESE